MKGFTYYAVSNLDNRIDNADQMLTQVCEALLVTSFHECGETEVARG